MSVTSKSPKAVLVTALQVAERSLPAYRHKYSPKKFTQHQLFACLVLKNFLKTDYRGVVHQLKDCPALADAICEICGCSFQMQSSRTSQEPPKRSRN